MSDGSADTSQTARLRQLAEFRYRLRSFLNFSEIEADKFGIAPQQYQLMQVIGAIGPGESTSISLLAERMVLRHNSTVELVDRAERAGLVRRAADERDLRRSLVVLTPRGDEVLQQMVASHLEQLQGECGDHLWQSLGEVRRSLLSSSSPDSTGIERVA